MRSNLLNVSVLTSPLKIICVLCSVPVLQLTLLAQPRVDLPMASPAAIQVNTNTPVVISALILPKNTVIPASVNVLRVSSSGQVTIVGTLNDNGANGDQLAGDGIFTGTVVFSASAVGSINLQVSAAFQGQLRRILSPQVSIEVASVNTPITVQPFDTSKLAVAPSGSTAICNQLLVIFSPTASPQTISSLISSVGATLVGRMPALGVYQVQFPQCDFSALATAQATLLSSADVESASVDSMNTPTTTSYVPNDPRLLSEQWYVINTRLPNAWGIVKTGATIGIIDTGVNYHHEDLAGQVILGINWCQTITNGVCAPGNDPAPQLGSDHGTGVAGIAAAIADNHLGVAGAAFNAKIIAEQVYVPKPPPNFFAPDSTVAYAIVDAVKLGARVINLSFSGDASALEQSAINYALNHHAVVVASAGNAGLSSQTYPAAYPGVISVGATDSNNQRAVWRSTLGGPCSATSDPGSEYGSWVDIYAPGTYMVWLSTTTNSGSGAYSVVCGGGTSAAAPLVTGTVALMLSVNPFLTPDQVSSIIKATGQSYLDNNGDVIKDPAGNIIFVLNAGAAVQAAVAALIGPATAGFTMSSGSSFVTENQSLNLTVPFGGTATVTFDASTRSSAGNGGTIVNWNWSITGVSLVFPRGPTSSFSQSLGPGTYTVSLTVTDSAGLQSTPATGTIVITQLAATGTVAAQATLDGAPWSGSVRYAIACSAKSITGTTVPASTANVAVGQCSLTYNSGGPPNSSFVSVSPSATQTLTAGGALTFTLQFSSSAPTAPSMNEPRAYHTATLLNNGTVLVTGGYNGTEVSNTAEIFDPQSGTWRYTLHPMNVARDYHTAVKLSDGRVLLVGGPSVSSEVFDPVTEQFTSFSGMNHYHISDPGLLLNDGRVLIVGGSQPSYNAGVSEIYSPITNAWIVAPNIPVGIANPAAVKLADGTVLAAGGNDGLSASAFSFVASYNPSADTVRGMAPMQVERKELTATLLLDGRVLLVGGTDANFTLSSTEVYDASVLPNGASTLASSLNQNRREHTATLLPNGDVVVVGGFQAAPGGPSTVLASIETRDHITGSWTVSGTVSQPITGHTATLLADGRVLLVGGANGTSSALANVEMF